MFNLLPKGQYLVACKMLGNRLKSHFRHLKKNKVAVTLVSTGFTPLFITKKTLYGNATSKYF